MDNKGLVPTFDRTLPIMHIRRRYAKDKERLYIFIGGEDTVPLDVKQHTSKAEKEKGYWHPSLGEYTHSTKRPADDIRFVYATVWPDDNVGYALTKVLLCIKEAEKSEKISDIIPFAWNRHGLLRFDWPSLRIVASSIDPWKEPFGVVEKQPLYRPYQLIGSDEINIVLYDDLRSLPKKELHMYFPDAEETKMLTPFGYIKSTETYLTHNWISPSPVIRSTSSKIKGAVFGASFDPSATGITLSDLYEKQKATPKVPLVQWTDDPTRVMYKLYKKHSIRTVDLRRWVDRYNIPKVPSLVLYHVWNKSSTYTRIQIQEDGNISIAYTIDTSDASFNTLDDVKNHASRSVDEIKEMLGLESLDTRMLDISYDVNIAISIVGLNEEKLFNSINDALGNAVPLFYMVHSHSEKRRKTMVFKRASNLGYQFSLPEIIQSMLDYGMHNSDIKDHLASLGYDKRDVQGAIEEVGFAQSEGKSIKPPLNFETDQIIMLAFSYTNDGMSLGVRHAPTAEEGKNALKWLASVIFHTIQDLRKDAKNYEVIPIEVEKEKGPSPVKKAISPGEEREPTPEEAPVSATSSSEFEFDGGAKQAKKTGDGFLLDRLQKADKIIFANEKTNYARGCQQDRQPLFMTKEEWELAKGKTANSMLYRNNYYSCPSIWCKEAGVVMTQDELKENKGRCPGTGERPVILWNEPKERFVGFNKNVITEDGKSIYSPCCFKSDQFEKALKTGKEYEDLIVYRSSGEPITFEKKEKEKKDEAKKTKQEDEEAYIFKKNEPVPQKGRYGSVPPALFRLFFPEYAEQGNNISTQPTIVRHGIGAHSDDSLMASIAYVLGFEGKTQLIEEIIRVLDPLTFVSLEGGAVLSAFTSDGVPHLSYEAWKGWVDGYPSYKALMGLDKEHSPTDPIILREIKVYEAYLRFVHHLQSNDEKNVRILYNLLARFGVLLIVWERDRSPDAIKLSCPYFIGYDDMKELVQRFKNRYIMLLHHKNYKYPYYEPLEIRALNKPPVREIALDEYPMARDVSLKCPIAYDVSDFVVIEKVRGIIHWTNNMFEFSSKQYLPKIIVISSDLRVEGIITFGSIWVQLPRPSLAVLPRMIEMLATMRIHPQVQYHEDVDTEMVSSRFYVINRTEYEVWKRRCQSIGFNVSERVPPPPPVVPVVSVMREAYQEEFRMLDRELRNQRDLQLRIARYLLYQYDNKVSKHVKKPRKDFVQEILDVVLTDLWKKENRTATSAVRRSIKTAIEEMPLIYGKDSLQKWIYTITLSPYRFYDSSVHTSDNSKDNWTFSQLAIEVGLPKDVVSPSVAATPKQHSVPDLDDVYPVAIAEQPPVGELPLMARSDDTRIEDMPSKWKKTNIKLMRVKRNRQEHIPDLFAWIAQRVHSPFVWDDVVRVRYIQIASYLRLPQAQFREAIGSLLQEPTFKRSLVRVLQQNKTTRDDDLLTHMWEERSSLPEKLQKVSEIQPTPIWPMDIDFRIMAQLFDMFVLIIYRKPYSIGKKEKEKEQTDIEKLRLSSILYSNIHTSMERPLIMLYREKDGEKGDKANIYSLIVSGKSTFYYPSASDASMEIQAIIKAHRENGH